MSDQRYLVAARKYRPKRFDEVVAQEHVTETLKNAIRLDRLGHAYLFSGPRGVGKTTVARILAKAINCTTPRNERDDEAEPCQECDSCESFEAGRSLNIFEMDAASNNSVDDIRELREKVRVPPQGGRKKVYIIDEVHMLSKSAFNAFLKTLEEPPPHALFIFATTEPHKVLPTILSRCQRFDFRRIPVPAIAEHLASICEAEGITADEASLLLLARKGDGALRDALSAFDQAVSLCGTDLRYPDLVDALGVVDIDRFFDVTRYAAEGNNAGLLQLANDLVSAGYDMREFMSGLAEHLRNIMVARSAGDTSLIEATETTRERYGKAAKHFTEPDVLRLLMIAADAEDRLRTSAQPRLQFELALLKMAGLARATDLREALERLDAIEEMAHSGEPATVTRAAEEPTSSYKASASDSAKSEEPEGPSSTPKESAPASSQESAPPSEPEISAPSPQSTTKVPPPSSSPSPSEGDALGLFKPPALRRKRKDGQGPQAESSGEGDASTSAAVTNTPPKAEALQQAWPRFVETVKQARVRIGAVLQDAKPLEIRGEMAVVGVPKPFHREMLRNERSYLLDVLENLADAPVSRLDVRIVSEENGHMNTGETDEVNPRAYFEKKRQEDPVIRIIFEQFGGELVW